MGGWAALALLTHCGGGETEEQAPVEVGPRAPAVVRQEVSTTLIFAASADARVEAAAPTRNLGAESLLVADLSPEQESHLRFDIRGVTGAVARATLWLYASDGTSDGPRVFLTSGGWTEGGLTWNNRPARDGGALDDKGAISSGSWVGFDVTGGVRGDGALHLAVVGTSGNGADFHSRESSRTDLRPRLVLEVEPAPDCMPRTESYSAFVEPTLDGYVSQAEPTRRFGGAPTLLVDAAPAVLQSYLQFSFQEPSAFHVREARLELYATDYTPDGPLLYRVSDDWAAPDLDWNTRPARWGGPVGNLGTIQANTWVAYDVSSVVTGGGTHSFGLIPESTNGVDFVSKDSPDGTRRPRLSLTLETEPYCTYRGAGGGLTGWARRYGGIGYERLHALATDATGGFVAAGLFGSEPFPIGSAGFALARYTSEGMPLWSRQVVAGDVRVRALAVTPEGNILVVGNYGGSPDLGTGPLTAAPASFETRGYNAFFVAKFSPTGEPVWAHGFVPGYDYPDGHLTLPVSPMAVATDAEGSLIVSGGFHGNLDLGGERLFAGSASIDFTGGDAVPGGFLAKFAWDGRHLWSKDFPAGSPITATTARTVSTDAAGNVLVGVDAQVDAYLTSGPLGEARPFIAKYDASGNEQWRRVFADAHGSMVGVRPLGTDAVAFLGNFVLTFTFGGRTYVAGGEPDFPYGGDPTAFIGVVTASGEDRWIHRLLPDSTDRAVHELVTGDGGTLTVSGYMTEMDLGGGPLGIITGSGPIPFVARYSAAGAHLWSRVFDRNLEGDFPSSRLYLAPQPGDSLVVGSDFRSPITLDGRTFTSRGASDLFYFQLTP